MMIIYRPGLCFINGDCVSTLRTARDDPCSSSDQKCEFGVGRPGRDLGLSLCSKSNLEKRVMRLAP
jgi:hypothetical protein